jgi:hypothetical protein
MLAVSLREARKQVHEEATKVWHHIVSILEHWHETHAMPQLVQEAEALAAGV